MRKNKRSFAANDRLEEVSLAFFLFFFFSSSFLFLSSSSSFPTEYNFHGQEWWVSFLMAVSTRALPVYFRTPTVTVLLLFPRSRTNGGNLPCVKRRQRQREKEGEGERRRLFRKEKEGEGDGGERGVGGGGGGRSRQRIQRIRLRDEQFRGQV